MPEKEAGKTCGTCEHYEYDEWYPSERICVCRDSSNCGDTRKKTDTCDFWEAKGWDEEGKGPGESLRTAADGGDP